MKWNRFFIYRLIIFLLIFFLSAGHVYADHLKGGWIQYTYNGEANGQVSYTVSFYQYSDCNQPEKVDPSIFMSFYDAGNKREISENKIMLTNSTTESKSDFGPCFQNQPTVCYIIATYTTNITVPVNDNGYILAVQRCCRIAGIENVPFSNQVGLTYTVTIPGGNTRNDNSPIFTFNETVAICYNTPFSFDFSAKDPDGDLLVYSLCSGLTGGTPNSPQVPNPPPPPYATIPYVKPYSGEQPLGPDVKIDPKTGILSGIAPSQLGTYVVAVCVDEFRNDVFIAHTRKELHLSVSNCSIGGARLAPSYLTCDGLNFTFQNEASIDPSYSYSWDFGVAGINSDTSSKPNPTYSYPDTGVYTVHLKADNNKGCEDTASTQVRIFPGFNAGFAVDASCITYPYNFKDLTETKYGIVNSWQWLFGDGTNDTLQNPSHNYTDTGYKTVTLISTNSKGCADTATKNLEVSFGPDLTLKFRDTLICSIDSLQLNSSSTTNDAVFSWTPSYNIVRASSGNPVVFPKQTTQYNVTVNYKGCVSNDSVQVNVINRVDVQLPADTTICKTDSILLNPATNALYFSWSPPLGLSSATIKNPSASPQSNTNYAVRASVGKCFADDNINVKVVPYPVVAVSPDVSICYGTTTQLTATSDGAYYTWSPSGSLLHATTLSPIAGPQSTTQYVLAATDTLGCPKPSYDTVLVTVIPKVNAFAGNDTSVVRTQPLQLNATGGAFYKWYPTFGLSNPDIANPLVTFTDQPDTVNYNVKVSTPEGCYSVDSIKIFIFNTDPQVFVPTAFTPNSDGKNDLFRPTAAGIKQFMYLKIFNRWGQLLFNSTRADLGWDGTFNGIKQPSGTYIFAVGAIDYNNKTFFKKGTFVLIR